MRMTNPARSSLRLRAVSSIVSVQSIFRNASAQKRKRYMRVVLLSPMQRVEKERWVPLRLVYCFDLEFHVVHLYRRISATSAWSSSALNEWGSSRRSYIDYLQYLLHARDRQFSFSLPTLPSPK